MRDADLPGVRALELFAGLSDDRFGKLVQAAFLQPFPAHVDLITEGDPADFLHIVLEGCVELFATTNGRETSIAMIRPVSTFILAAVISDGPCLMSARTCQPSRVLLIPTASIYEAIQEDTTFSNEITRELARSYRHLVKTHKDLKLRTAVERLANRLLRYHREQGGNGKIQLPYDKRKLASLMAMTPENLSRAFNTLKPYGVKVDGAEVILDDIDALTVLAKPNPLIDNLST